jgi:hypothetical protein
MEHTIASATTTGCAAACCPMERQTHALRVCPVVRRQSKAPTNQHCHLFCVGTQGPTSTKFSHECSPLGLYQFAHMEHRGAELRASPQLECHRYRKMTTRMTVTPSHCTATHCLRRLSTKFSHAILGKHTMHVFLWY